MPLKPASATSNLMMGVTAAASALVYFFNGTIRADIAVPIALGIVLGATIGAGIMPYVPAIPTTIYPSCRYCWYTTLAQSI